MNHINPLQESDLVSKLTNKISQQAQELTNLHHQLDKSNQIIDNFEKNQDNFNEVTFSDETSKRKTERENTKIVESLHRQLEVVESKLHEALKSKKKLITDLESKTRECKFYEKQCTDTQIENQNLKMQLETLKSKTIIAKKLTPSKTIHHRNGSSDEISRLKQENEKYKSELNLHIDNQSQLQLRIIVLEEALEFRSQEIGLAGHADLLTKIAKLRGEVSALKEELQEKHNKLSDVEEDKSDLISRHESLQHHIVQIQQRLAQSQQDMYKLQHGDIINILKATEKERDVLLEYIQSDTKQTHALQKELDRLESEQRISKKQTQLLEENVKHLTSNLESTSKRLEESEKELSLNSLKLRETERIQHLLEEDKETYTKILDKKKLELDEMSKMHLSLLTQLKEKETENQSLNQSLVSAKVRIQELELNAPVLQNDNATLRHRLKFMEQEMITLQEQLTSLEPRFIRMEPELNKLRMEQETWLEEKTALLDELNRIRPIHQVHVALANELNQYLHELQHKPMNSPKRHGHDPSETPSITQHHAQWICLPSIMSLNPDLYDRLRQLLQDLLNMEMECQDLRTTSMKENRYRKELEEEMNNKLKQLNHTQMVATETIEKLNDRLISQEKELFSHRNARITLDQIKTVLQSYPGGGIQVLLDQDPIESSSSKSRHEADVLQVKDQELPDVIGKALVYNSSAVRSLQEKTHRLRKVEQEHEVLQEKYRQLKHQTMELEANFEEVVEKFTKCEKRLQEYEGECKDQMESAAELAEKQNALTMTLEAKIEGIQRDRQLKAAQITALQQREDTVRSRLLTVLQEYAYHSGDPVPPSSTKIVDLIHFCNEIIRKFTQNLIANPNLRNGKTVVTSPLPNRYRNGTYTNDKIGISRSFSNNEIENPVSMSTHQQQKRYQSPNIMTAHQRYPTSAVHRNESHFDNSDAMQLNTSARTHRNDILGDNQDLSTSPLTYRIVSRPPHSSHHSLTNERKEDHPPAAVDKALSPLQIRLQKARQAFAAIRQTTN